MEAGRKGGLMDRRHSPNTVIKALYFVGNPADWSLPLMRVVLAVAVLVAKDTR